MNYRDTVWDFIVDNFLFGERARIEPDTSFIESGIIDSTGILELVGFLESKYKIQIADEELVPENFNDLNKIAAYLEHKLSSESKVPF